MWHPGRPSVTAARITHYCLSPSFERWGLGVAAKSNRDRLSRSILESQLEANETSRFAL